MSAIMMTRSAWLKRGGRRALGCGLLLALACALPGGCNRLMPGDSTAAQTAEVVPRDFAVVLKEKGELKAAKSTDIKCEVEGRSTIIWLVPEGTAVEEGDLLVELASDEIEDRIRSEELREANAVNAYEAAQKDLEIQLDRNASDIRKGELEITLKELALSKYTDGDYPQAQKDHEIAIEQARIMLERSAEKWEAAQKLFEKEFYTKAEYKEAEINFKRAQWDLEKAQRSLVVLEKYTHKADFEQKQSDLAEARKECERIRKAAEAQEASKRSYLDTKKRELDLIQDQLAKFRTQRDKCKIYAPTQGFVVYGDGGSGGRRFFSVDGSGQVKEGATVYERQMLMQLPDTSQMIAVVRIHEAKTDRIKMGQSATLEIEGIPGKRFTGTVTKIAVVADTQNRWLNPDLKEYETEITMEPNGTALKPGVTAYAEILVERVEQRLAVPVQAVYAKAGHNFVFRKGTSAEPEPVEVTLGSAGSEWVEIVEGIDRGTQVLLAVSEEHERLLPDLPAPTPEIAGIPPGASPVVLPAGGPTAAPGARVQFQGEGSGRGQPGSRRGPRGGGPGQGRGQGDFHRARGDDGARPTPAPPAAGIQGDKPAEQTPPGGQAPPAARPAEPAGQAPPPPAGEAPKSPPGDAQEHSAEPTPSQGTQAP